MFPRGGILEIHAADDGPHNGIWDNLPCNLSWNSKEGERIDINGPKDSLLIIPNNITDEELDNWGNSYNGYFINTPKNSNLILNENDTGNDYPVLSLIPFGKGLVLASGLTLEHGYENNYSTLLENLILYGKELISSLSVKINQVDNTSFPNITIYATINTKGKHSIEFSEENFIVYEDGILEEPIKVSFEGNKPSLSVAMAMDYSRSMEPQDISNMEEAAHTLVDHMKKNDQGAILKFDQNVNVVQDFTSNKTLLREAVNSTHNNWGTSLYDAIYLSVDVTKERLGRKIIIVFTDGDDFSSSHSLNETIEHAVNNGIPIYTIGLGNANESILNWIANETGGEYHYTPTSSELRNLILDIIRSLEAQFIINYTTHNPNPDGSLRNVQLDVNFLRLQNIDTSGYYAPQPPPEPPICNIFYPDGWQTITQIPIELSVKGVKIDEIQFEFNRAILDKGKIIEWDGWQLLSEWTGSYPKYYNFVSNNGYAYKFRLRAKNTEMSYFTDWEEPSNITRIDTTEPVVGSIISPEITHNNTKLNITLNEWFDLESDIAIIRYQITKNGESVIDWKELNGNQSEIIETNLFEDGFYFFNVSCENGARTKSLTLMSLPILLFTKFPVCNVFYPNIWQTKTEIEVKLSIIGEYVDNIQLEFDRAELNKGKIVEWEGWQLLEEWDTICPPVYNFNLKSNGYAYKFRLRANITINQSFNEWKLPQNITKIDTTPPITGNLISSEKTNDYTKINFFLNDCFDPESDIVKIRYQITDERGIVIDWIEINGNPKEIIHNAIFNYGIYYVNVSCVNGAGNQSLQFISDPIEIIEQPSSTIFYTNDWQTTTKIQVKLGVKGKFIDKIRLEFKRAILDKGEIGLWENWQLLDEWNTNCPPVYIYNSTNGYAYKFRIIVNDFIYNQYLEWISNSPKFIIKIDKTSPTVGKLDINEFLYSEKELTARIKGFSDLESGITEYQYRISTVNGSHISGWKSNGVKEIILVTHIIEDDFGYFVEVKAKNGAGIWSRVVKSNTVKIQLPDLAISIEDIEFKKDGKIVKSFIDGDVISIVITIHNLGDSPANDVAICVYHNNKNISQLIGSETVDTILPNDRKSIEISWQIETSGDNKIIVSVDPTDWVEEIDETNNVVSLDIEIKKGDNTVNLLWFLIIFAIIGFGIIMLTQLKFKEDNNNKTNQQFNNPFE